VSSGVLPSLLYRFLGDRQLDTRLLERSDGFTGCLVGLLPSILSFGRLLLRLSTPTFLLTALALDVGQCGTRLRLQLFHLSRDRLRVAVRSNRLRQLREVALQLLDQARQVPLHQLLEGHPGRRHRAG
jgi:hypothetical protein